jgi:tRNA-uridine 2-sulfurtransferase
LVDVTALPEIVNAQVRYRTAPVPARLTRADENGFALSFLEPQFAVTPGQSVVLYDDSRLLGGGFIRTNQAVVPSPSTVAHSSVATAGD